MTNQTPIEDIRLNRGGIAASVLTIGAALHRLDVTLPSGPRPAILSLADPEAYRANPHYLGVIAGRCANRIRGGDCVIGGHRHQLDLNEAGRTHLHGGTVGFSRRHWSVRDRDGASVTLELQSPDGDMGYPGNVVARCRYELLDGDGLRLTLTAECDAETLVNLAGHAYFNLAPGRSILDHRLAIAADRYTPVDAGLIPDGRLLPVAGTAFDFRATRTIGSRREGSPQGYDHNFVLASAPSPEARHAATLASPDGDLAMDIRTTEPGLQFYDGQKLTPDPAAPLPGHRQFGACCLEPQRFPDAIHHPGFAQSLLRPGQVYRQVTEYWFRQPGP